MKNQQSLRQVLREFNLSGDPLPLTGGTTQTYRVGDAVLKRIHESSLENSHSLILSAWIAEVSSRLPQDFFRLPRPLLTVHQTWITADGWTAATFLEGRIAEPEDIPACIHSARAFHAAISTVPMHPLMDDNRTAWGFAHRGVWGEKPLGLQPELSGLVDELYALRRPLETSPWQIFHGDLNLPNFLIAPGLPPAILDFTPFWGPPEFALATFAMFSGPRRFDMAPLRYFEDIPHFDQLLVRAAIRMLLVVAALNGLDGWAESEEKWSAEHVIEYVREKACQK
jgi:hypothetical protein